MALVHNFTRNSNHETIFEEIRFGCMDVSMTAVLNHFKASEDEEQVEAVHIFYLSAQKYNASYFYLSDSGLSASSLLFPCSTICVTSQSATPFPVKLLVRLSPRFSVSHESLLTSVITCSSSLSSPTICLLLTSDRSPFTSSLLVRFAVAAQARVLNTPHMHGESGSSVTCRDRGQDLRFGSDAQTIWLQNG